MNRHRLSLAHEHRTSFDLEAFTRHAGALNRQHCEAFPSLFPKAPRRWLSHYQFIPRPITLTTDGNVDGGLSWLVGATLDFSCTRALCAPHYGARGGPCYDPASLFL